MSELVSWNSIMRCAWENMPVHPAETLGSMRVCSALLQPVMGVRMSELVQSLDTQVAVQCGASQFSLICSCRCAGLELTLTLI